MLSGLPAAITRYELAGHTAHERLATLAADLGWEPTVKLDDGLRMTVESVRAKLAAQGES